LSQKVRQHSESDRSEEIRWRDRVQISQDLAEILEKMVRYDFRQRYPSATEALQAIAFFNIKPAWTVFFGDAKTMSGNPMLERRAGHLKFIVGKHQTWFHRMYFDGIGKAGLAVALTGIEIVIQSRRAVNIDTLNITSQTAASKQAHQSKDMIAVHVGDKNFSNLAGFNVAAHNLVLRALAAVKQPNLRPLR
jgi:hypothetical protein